MQDRDRDQLKRLIEHAEAARAYARAGGARWWTDQLTRDAVMMRIAQIAEAAKRTSPEALAEVEGVAWAEIRGMRTRIVHDYDKVDLAILRQTVAEDLDSLIANVRKVIS